LYMATHIIGGFIGSAIAIAVSVAAGWPDNWGQRDAFVKELLSQARDEGLNVFVCHPRHTVRGETVHRHHELYLSTGGSIGFDVHMAAPGIEWSATNHGDGTFSNWGYSGEDRREGMTVYFS
jgi:hypothetical protein